MRISTTTLAAASSAALVVGGVGTASAQLFLPLSGLTRSDIVVQTGPESAGRGAPLPPVPDTIVGADLKGLIGGIGAPGPDAIPVVAARDGAAPDGITPLPRDIFSSDDFYIDKDLWMDSRYYRCNSPYAIEGAWGAYEAPIVGDNPPATVYWGYCDRDYPRDQIVSPYPYETAQEQYEALMAEAGSRGGPTQYTYENPPPNWNGIYAAAGFGTHFSNASWFGSQLTQVPTYLSLLTPEYQQRFVQQMYHYAASNAPEWPGAYCWPEGFMRRFLPGADWVTVAPDAVQILTRISETMPMQVHIGSKFKMDGSVPNLQGDVRQWYGDTIGFWDGDILVTWTSNIKAWLAHSSFEFSDQLQSIEIYSPVADKAGKFVGLAREAILYDPVALVQPVRIVETWERVGGLNDQPFDWRECNQTLFPIDGKQMPVSPGTTIEFTVPDLSGRPWADLWEKYFEQGMQKPEENDVLSDFN